jgi:hypothetical protein
MSWLKSHLNTEKPDIELRRRLDKIEALGLLLGNQEWGAPLEGKYYDKLGHTIADLAMEAKEIFENMPVPAKATPEGGGE